MIFLGCLSKNSTNNTSIIIQNMEEEESYGIDKEHAHPRSIELIPEDFFWDITDGLAPFGSDEGDMALSEFRDWRENNPNTPIKACIIWTIESVGEMKINDYNESLLVKDKIKDQIFNPNFDDQQYIFTLDISVIATGFGQLVDEGKIDEEIKPILSIAIRRLIIWSEIQSDWGHSNQFIANLKVLERVLKDA